MLKLKFSRKILILFISLIKFRYLFIVHNVIDYYRILQHLPRSGRQTGLIFPSNRMASFSLMSAMSLL